MFYNENLYYLLCSCTNPIFLKNLVSEIKTKMVSANQIVGFSNQLFLQKKLMKHPHLLQVDRNSKKLKVDLNFLLWKWPVWSKMKNEWMK